MREREREREGERERERGREGGRERERDVEKLVDLTLTGCQSVPRSPLLLASPQLSSAAAQCPQTLASPTQSPCTCSGGQSSTGRRDSLWLPLAM